jgi:hypothetical protein
MAEEIEQQEIENEEVENREEVDTEDVDVNNDEEDVQEDDDDESEGVENTEDSEESEEEKDINKEGKSEEEEKEEEESEEEKKSLGSIIKEKYPDVTDENLEEYTTKYISELQKENEELSEYQEKNREVNGKLVEILESSDELGMVIRDMDKGATFVEALAYNVDIDDLKPPKDSPDYKKWEEAKAERVKRIEESQKARKEFEENKNESISTLRNFFEENEIKEEDAAKFTEKVDNIMTDISKGKYSKQALTFFWNALNAEQKIKDAEKVGEIKGKNAKIETKKKEKKGDGIPKLSSSKTKPKKKDNPVDKVVDGFLSRQSRF